MFLRACIWNKWWPLTSYFFPQLAAQAENADNAAEQKRQLGKRVRYGEIIQVEINFILYFTVLYL